MEKLKWQLKWSSKCHVSCRQAEECSRWSLYVGHVHSHCDFPPARRFPSRTKTFISTIWGLKKSKSAAIHVQEPDCWFGARVISLAITFNQVHFLHSLKVMPLGKKNLLFHKRRRKTAHIVQSLRTQNLNKWVEAHLTSTPQRDDGKLQQKGAWLLKVGERAFSGKAPHKILRYLSNQLSDEILHWGIQWMDAYIDVNIGKNAKHNDPF